VKVVYSYLRPIAIAVGGCLGAVAIAALLKLAAFLVCKAVGYPPGVQP
jgi:hypothetical protein